MHFSEINTPNQLAIILGKSTLITKHITHSRKTIYVMLTNHSHQNICFFLLLSFAFDIKCDQSYILATIN